MENQNINLGDKTNFNSPLGVSGDFGDGSHIENSTNMYYGALPIHFELAKKLRDNQTEAEIFLWENLPRLDIKGIRFKRQHPILYFIADFYCHKLKLVIEIDGGYHNFP
jgi:very-short-patch-repair endonuclease